ncbi:uncharacterized protein LOC122296670 [Carya illinoinensis]|uniref:uncharacterized protein LOC122296670 n=1 Tax=Carya illinoinensis TaxID=32201 RepID=UPI001C728AF4|nr:uncharacterized protein LOC122296670 [Carya illinoinensis]
MFVRSQTESRGVTEALAYKDENRLQRDHQQLADQRVLSWQKPARGSYQVNWDAALKVETGKMGLGVIVRDHQGYVIEALRARRPLAGKAFEAEAYGLVVTATFCKELGLNQIHIEGDSKRVINLMHGMEKNWSMGGLLVEDAKNILSSIGNWKATHVYLEGNKAVHKIAKSTLNLDEDVYDIEECPLCIQSNVIAELFSA